MAIKGQIDVGIVFHIVGMRKKQYHPQLNDLQDNSLSDSSLTSHSGITNALFRAFVAIKKPQQN